MSFPAEGASTLFSRGPASKQADNYQVVRVPQMSPGGAQHSFYNHGAEAALVMIISNF